MDAARNNVKSKSIYNLLMDFDKVLALDLDKKEPKRRMIYRRGNTTCRAASGSQKNKDWKKSDQLRDRIRQLGYSINDTPAGQVIKKG